VGSQEHRAVPKSTEHGGVQYNSAPLPPSDGPTHGNHSCFWCTETASQVGHYVNGRMGLDGTGPQEPLWILYVRGE